MSVNNDKEYIIIEDGNAIIKLLKERYPKCFWTVDPNQVIVLGVSNKPRPFSQKKLAKITKIDSAHKTIIRTFCRKDIQYIIEIYCTDWIQWNNARRQWIIAHEIGHIDAPGTRGLVKHDVEDWGWLLDSVGIDWWGKENLPDLLDGPVYHFRQELFDRIRSSVADDDVEALGDGGDSHGSNWGANAH